MSSAPKVAKKSGGMSRIKSRATAKATGAETPALTPSATPEPPVAPQATETSPPAPASVPAPAARAAAPVGEGPMTNLTKVSVPQAVQAQKTQLERAGARELFIDFTDAGGGSATRVRTSIHVGPEALDALYALQIDEAARFGKAPKTYHYVELALLKFIPTADEASQTADTSVPHYEPISTVVSKEAKLVMRSTRKVKNASGVAVVKHWYYTQAIVRNVAPSTYRPCPHERALPGTPPLVFEMVGCAGQGPCSFAWC